MRLVALLTDFGLADHYVGVLHAVLERDAGGAPRIDLCHGIRQGDVWAGCFVLGCAWASLPESVVVLGVIDPGVGTDRRAVAAQYGDRWLVAPDNGLAAAPRAPGKVVELDARAMGLPEPSSTFHGRDLFAPAAARLARGDDPETLGSPSERPLTPSPLPEPRREGEGRVVGAVVYHDHFGNLVTNIPGSWLPESAEVRCGPVRVRRRVSTYGEAPPGTLVFLEGSCGLVEIAVSQGSADEALAVRRGDRVVVVSVPSA